MLSAINRTMAYCIRQNAASGNLNTDKANANFQDALSCAISKAESSFTISKTTNNIEDSNSYLSQLQMKFGSKISVQNLEYSKANIDHIGSSTSGTGNVIIAPNILEKMVSDPQARQHYEKKIQAHFDTNGEANAFMAMRGRRIVSRGVIIHPNGEVTYYCSSDYTPEEKARLEKAMKEEDEAKAKKRAEQRKLNELVTGKSLLISKIPEIGLITTDGFEHYFSVIPLNIDTSLFTPPMFYTGKLR